MTRFRVNLNLNTHLRSGATQVKSCLLVLLLALVLVHVLVALFNTLRTDALDADSTHDVKIFALALLHAPQQPRARAIIAGPAAGASLAK